MWTKSPYVHFKYVVFWNFNIFTFFTWNICLFIMNFRMMILQKINFDIIWCLLLYICQYSSDHLILELRFYECCHSCYINFCWLWNPYLNSYRTTEARCIIGSGTWTSTLSFFPPEQMFKTVLERLHSHLLDIMHRISHCDIETTT